MHFEKAYWLMHRKPTFLILLFLLAFSFCVKAQNYSIDSLENKLRGQLSDSLRLRTLMNLSYAYQYTDLKKSFAFAGCTHYFPCIEIF